MKGIFVFFAMLTYAGMAVYSIGTMPSGSAATTAYAVNRLATKSASRITLTTANTTAMVNFYNEVFNADLQPVATDDRQAVNAYQGNLAGAQLLLYPRQGARSRNEQYRRQLRVEVVDLEETAQLIAAFGGRIESRPMENSQARRMLVRDPDGNIIQLIQLKG
jgi:predicted enzyme related to lactoylglutathione lyase